VLNFASVGKTFASVDRKRWEVSMDGRLSNTHHGKQEVDVQSFLPVEAEISVTKV
jgi:hypothetical protein